MKNPLILSCNSYHDTTMGRICCRSEEVFHHHNHAVGYVLPCLTPLQTVRQIHHLLQQVFLWFIITIIISLLSPSLLGKIIWLFKPSGKYLSQFSKPPSIRLWNVQIIFQLIQIIRNKKNLLSAGVHRPQNSCHHDWSCSDFNCINVHCTSPSWQLARDDLSYFSSNEYFTMWVPGVAWSLGADYLHKCLDCCCLSVCLSWYNWHSPLSTPPPVSPMSNWSRKLAYKVIYNVMSYCDDTKPATRWQMSLRHCTRFYKFNEKSRVDCIKTEIVCNHSEQIFVWDSKQKYCYDVGGGGLWWYMVGRNT